MISILPKIGQFFSRTILHFSYAFGVVLILLGCDLAYSQLNDNFRFFIAEKEVLKLLLGALIVSFFYPKWRSVIFLVLLAFSFFQYVHFEFYGRNIDAIEFTLLLNNIGEVTETASHDLSIFVLPLLLVVITFFVFYLLEKLWAGKRLLHSRWAAPVWVFLLVAIFGQVFYLVNMKTGESLTHNESKLIYPTANRHSARNYFVSANYALANMLGKLIFIEKANAKTFPAATVIKTKTPQNRIVVLIIGESLRADRFFDPKITPKLSALRLSKTLQEKTIYSGGTMTKVSVATLVNIVPGPGYLEQIANESTCLFRLAKENGFHTSFISNQSPEKLDIIRNLICPKYIDNYVDKKSMQGKTGLDEDVLTHLKQQASEPGNHFYILHHRGSHSPYEKQFPPKSKDEKLSDYDNSVKYTDTVIYDLFDYFKQQKQDVFWAFTPDHGELLGEQGMHGHGFMESQVYRVPLSLWSNYDEALGSGLSAINSHQQLASYIALQLGYKVDHKLEHINILNSDLEGFSGHGEVIDGKVVFKRPH